MEKDPKEFAITYKKINREGLRERQYDRWANFLRFHRPPWPLDPVNVIIVATDSPNIDLTSFNMRIDSGIEFSKRYPNATVIFSGKRPDLSRANPDELQDGYSEAKLMADRAINLGLNAEVVLEEESLHSGQHIPNAFDLIADRPLEGVLVVCSSYMARRMDYYLKKELKIRNLVGKFATFIFDADVAWDLAGSNLSLEEQARKKQRVLYEAQRLSLYRKQGDL